MAGSINKLLLGYAVVMTTGLAAMTASRALGAAERTAFTEIDVQRINVVEKDGTLRLVISNTDRFPGVIHRGKNHPHPDRRTAGMLFYNEEGTENGGLIFGGRRDEKGRVVGSLGHLSFDQYEQDQVVALNQSESGAGRRAGLTISDRPDKFLPYEELGRLGALSEAERAATVERLVASGAVGGKTRLFAGKTADRVSTVRLSDAEGRARLVLQVAPDGAASIQFLDAAGKVVRTVSPEG